MGALDLAGLMVLVIVGHVALFGLVWAVARPARPPVGPAWAAWRAATARAEALLAERLTRDEYARWRQDDYVDVPSPRTPGRIYRIRRYRDLIDVYQDGRLEARLCVRSTARLPEADVALAQKLMIEADEPAFLRLANEISVSRWF